MRVLLVSPSRMVRDIFISELIPRGITLSWCENINDALGKWKEKKVFADVVVLEVISKYDAVSFLSLIREISPRPVIVLYTEIHSQSEVYEYLKLGVGGFLQKPLVAKNIFTVVVKAYENFKGAPPERQVVRVQLSEGEGVVEFFNSQGVKIIGNILDLSVGGLAFSYTSKYENHFHQGDNLQKIRLILKEEETFLKGTVKLKDDSKRISVILFTELNPDAIQKISKFIFYQTSV